MIYRSTENAKSIQGQALNTLELVCYQNNSIVSREIVRKDTGIVTLFAFDQGQGLSEHKSPFDALLSVLEGEVDITISGRTVHLKSGQMIIMPANKPHALMALSQFKMMLIMIKSPT
jgi:quercetin dioxygenase-like cupin family protein